MDRRITFAFVLLAAACARGGVDDVASEPAPALPALPAQPDAGPRPIDEDGDGVPAGVDCDDHHALVHPGAPEVCNGVDDDCNGKVDDVPASLAPTSSDPHWAFAWSASLVDGWAQLTSDAVWQTGALWWNAPYVFDRFDAHASFWIQAKPSGTGADGLAFAWVPGADVSRAGDGGPGLGVAGLGGWAVAIDTYQNPEDPPAPSLAILDGATGKAIARAPLPEIRDAHEHTLAVRLEAATVTVWVDGVLYLHQIELPGYAPFSGHWGFTAATGGLGESHAVRNVTMTFPDGQGCVP